MTPLKRRLQTMATDPKKHLKRMLWGTLGSVIAMILLLYTSSWESRWLFYLLSGLLISCALYALPGYLGIWLWRMRHVFFDQS
jgi:hypothetical protein